MAIEKRDLVRWFKKGWVYIIITTIITLIVSNFGITSAQGLMNQLAANPTGAITGLLAVGLLGLAWALVAFPLISGWLVEEVDKRIRK